MNTAGDVIRVLERIAMVPFIGMGIIIAALTFVVIGITGLRLASFNLVAGVLGFGAVAVGLFLIIISNFIMIAKADVKDREMED